MTNPTDRSPSDDEIHNRLPPLHYHVAQEAGAERAFTSGYWDTKDAGVYLRVVCETALSIATPGSTSAPAG
jgi:peptide methionine sulfoxide reductase MsrB